MGQGWQTERSSHNNQKLRHFSPIPCSLGKGEGLEIELCVHDEASIKIPNAQGPKSVRVDEHIRVLGAGGAAHPNSVRTEVRALRTLPDLTLRASAPGCSLVSFIINQQKSFFP